VPTEIFRARPRAGIKRAPTESCITKAGQSDLIGRSSVAKEITHDHNTDGIDRRGFLECMVWAGTGVGWTVTTVF